jgi:hypothetical protein
MRLAFLFLACTLTHHCAIASAQEVGSKDLSSSAAPPCTAVTPQKERETPKGCDHMGVGFVDGWSLAKDKVPRKIKVELLDISTAILRENQELMATVKLRNAGSTPIVLPWSTDFRTSIDGQELDNREWEIGWFEWSLKTKGDRHDDLRGTSQQLYSSPVIPGSTITVQPGEWIRAQVSFKVAVRDPRYESLPSGPAELTLEWRQTVRSRHTKGCAVMLGYFPYDSFYGHEGRVTVKKVTVKRSENSNRPQNKERSPSGAK